MADKPVSQDAAPIQHASIASALAAAQGEMGKALKQSQNPHFKSRYADLASVMDACMPALSRNGIAVIQPVAESEFGRSVITRFIHTSGECLECAIPLILGKNDMQGLGSALTYARRYGLMALAGIAPEDDDGNAAVQAGPAKAPKSRSWAQTVVGELPEGSTEYEKAQAISEAICASFKRKRTQGELDNEWERRLQLTEALRKYPDLFDAVHKAYETRTETLGEARAEKDRIPSQ